VSAVAFGVDVGSTTCKAVALDASGRCLARRVEPTDPRIEPQVERVLRELRQEVGVDGPVGATGYGRKRVPAGRALTEITCHARGAFAATRRGGVLVDMGGQDTKVIRIGPSGEVLDFAMNDKCAAGTGRFLEVMARTLEMDLEQMGARSLAASRALPVSSTCTVFAESEAVSLIASGAAPEDIAWGIHLAISERIAALAERIGVAAPAVMTGGVAKNPAARKALEDRFRLRFLVPEEPQLAGALGAALIALERNRSPH
jgi:predicted CoA-substrate-specific enzyme activase